MEHPVTEWIAEINLPAAQVAVGMGIPLWQIPGFMQEHATILKFLINVMVPLYYCFLIFWLESFSALP